MLSPITLLKRLLLDRRYFWVLAALVVLGDAILTQLIIHYIPYTEIDFTTYLRHIDVYRSGERDYALFKGPSGPLVYPAGHVLIHRMMHTLTQGGENLRIAQHIYAALYSCSQVAACAIYWAAGGVPNWIIILFTLSKRLHSIYALRLFNDCWAIYGLYLAIFSYSRGRFAVGSALFSAALSVKMNILLYLPALLLVLTKTRGLFTALTHVAFIIIPIQILVALPYLTTYPQSYLANAFELSRVFMYKWTVNWRFIDENVFLSRPWAMGLLLGHLSTLLLFLFSRWCQNDGGAWALIWRALRRPNQPAAYSPVTSDEVVTIFFTCNLIGILFARSLHYQFYSWYALQLPFLAWRIPYPIPIKLILLGCTEYAWNTFPSTDLSSGILLLAHLALLIGIWNGWPLGKNTAKVGSKSV